MLRKILTTIASLLVGFAAAVILQEWTTILDNTVTDTATAGILVAVVALCGFAAGGRLLGTFAVRSRRRDGLLLLLVLLASGAAVAGPFCALETIPGLASLHPFLALAGSGLLLLVGSVLVGGLYPVLTRSAALDPAQEGVAVLALIAMGGALGLGGTLLHLINDLGHPGSLFLAGGLLLLASGPGVAGMRSREPASGGEFPPGGSPGRISSRSAVVTLGLAAGAALFLLARYGPLLFWFRPDFPASGFLVAVVLFLSGLTALLGAFLFPRLPIRSLIASAALAIASFLAAGLWGQVKSRLLSEPAQRLTSSLNGSSTPSFSDTLQAVLMAGPTAALVGLGVALLVPALSIPSGPSGRRAGEGAAFLAVSLAAGILLASLLLPFLGWRTGLLPPLFLAAGSGIALLTGRGRLVLRVPAAILVLVGVAAGHRPLLARLEAPPAPTVLATYHSPSAWVEILEAPENPGCTLARVDRRYLLGAATSTTRRMIAMRVLLPAFLHPSPRALLLVEETTGSAVEAALSLSGVAVESTWARPALGRHYGPGLESTTGEAGTTYRSLSGPGHAALLERGNTYDVIVDLLPSSLAEQCPGLRTSDYFRQASAALNPGGLFCQWVPVHGLTREETSSMVAAFLEVFPGSATGWTPDLRAPRPWLGLIGTREEGPLRIDLEALESRLDLTGKGALSDPTDIMVLLSHDTPSLHRLAEGIGGIQDERLQSFPWSPTASARKRIQKALETGRHIRAAHRKRLEADAGRMPEVDALTAEFETAMAALDDTPHLPFVWRFLGGVGEALIRAGQRDEAARLFDRAVEKAPDWGGGYLGKATLMYSPFRAFQRAEDWRTLADLAEKAVERDSTLARAWIYLGVTFIEARHDPERARGCFENAARINPGDPLLKGYLWQFIERDGRIEEASALLLDAYEHYPRNGRLRDALFKMTPKLLLAGHSRQALFILLKIEKNYLNDPSYFLTRSQVLESLNDHAGAIEAARTSCNLIEAPQQGYLLHLYRLLKKSTRNQETENLRKFMKITFGRDPEVMLGVSQK